MSSLHVEPSRERHFPEQTIEKGQPAIFNLDKEGNTAVCQLKGSLLSAPILAFIREHAALAIKIDTWCKQGNCVLLQPQQNDQKNLNQLDIGRKR